MSTANKLGTLFLAAVALVVGLSIFASKNPIAEDFKLLNKVEQSSYCLGVFEYGVRNTADTEQRRSFEKATEWFLKRGGGVAGINNAQRDRAKVDLENFRKAGDSSAFEEAGTICADIVIREKK